MNVVSDRHFKKSELKPCIGGPGGAVYLPLLVLLLLYHTGWSTQKGIFNQLFLTCLIGSFAH